MSDSSPHLVARERGSKPEPQPEAHGDISERAKYVVFFVYGLGSLSLGVAVVATLMIGENIGTAIIAASNVGESTATLVKSSVRLWVHPKTPRLPAVPPYASPTDKPRITTLRNGEESRWGEPGDWSVWLAELDRNRQHIMLLGYIIYADDLGARRRVGFCRRIDAETDADSFQPSSNPDYEYED